MLGRPSIWDLFDIEINSRIQSQLESLFQIGIIRILFEDGLLVKPARRRGERLDDFHFISPHQLAISDLCMTPFFCIQLVINIFQI